MEKLIVKGGTRLEGTIPTRRMQKRCTPHRSRRCNPR